MHTWWGGLCLHSKCGFRQTTNSTIQCQFGNKTPTQLVIIRLQHNWQVSNIHLHCLMTTLIPITKPHMTEGQLGNCIKSLTSYFVNLDFREWHFKWKREKCLWLLAIEVLSHHFIPGGPTKWPAPHNNLRDGWDQWTSNIATLHSFHSSHNLWNGFLTKTQWRFLPTTFSCCGFWAAVLWPLTLHALATSDANMQQCIWATWCHFLWSQCVSANQGWTCGDSWQYIFCLPEPSLWKDLFDVLEVDTQLRKWTGVGKGERPLELVGDKGALQVKLLGPRKAGMSCHLTWHKYRKKCIFVHLASSVIGLWGRLHLGLGWVQ